MQAAISRRNVNLDVLRCMAMLMVVVSHFFCYGIVPLTTEEPFWNLRDCVGLINFVLSQIVIVVSSTCVNLFILVSGYFIVTKPVKWKRVVLIWLETVFYGLGISLLFYIINPGDIHLKDLVNSLFPVRSYQYWFISTYLGLICLAPFLSVIVNHLNQVQYRCLLLVSLIFGCTISYNIPFGESMGVLKGYSLIWFVILVLWSGYVRRFSFKISSRSAFFAFLAAVSCSFVFIILKIVFYRHTFSFELPAYNGFSFFISIALFVWFIKKKEFSGVWTKTLSLMVPYLLGVYLISEHPNIRPLLWTGLYDWALFKESIWFIPVMLAVVLSVFILCIIIDFGREQLFKIFHVNTMADWLCRVGGRIIDRFCGIAQIGINENKDAS